MRRAQVAFRKAEEELSKAIGKFAEERRMQRLRAVRLWAASAGSRAAHAATKVKETATAHSASARKDHLGEVTAQKAADVGIEEWSEHWDAVDVDNGNEILNRAEALIT